MLLAFEPERTVDPFGPDELQCPVRELLARVGGRWSLDVMIALAAQSRHYADLERTIPGVSRRMLTATLRGLERDGLISRAPQRQAGDRVYYELTALGDEFAVHLRALAAWSQRNRQAIYAARDRFDNALGYGA